MTMNQSTVTVTEDSDRPYGEQSDGCRDRQLRPACLPVLADSPDTTRTCGYWLGRVHTPRVRVGSGRCLTIFARKKIIKYAFMEKNFKFSTSQSTKMCYFRKKNKKYSGDRAMPPPQISQLVAHPAYSLIFGTRPAPLQTQSCTCPNRQSQNSTNLRCCTTNRHRTGYAEGWHEVPSETSASCRVR